MAALNVLLLLLGQTQGAPSFETDPRLDKPIAFAAYAQPLSELVEKLSKDLQTPLSTDSFLREDLVVLITKPRPARESMAKLANHFGWRWTLAKGGGYRIEPTEEFRQGAEGGPAFDLLEGLRKIRANAKAIATKKDATGPFTPAAALLVAEMSDDQLRATVRRRLVFSDEAKPFCLPLPAAVKAEASRAVAFAAKKGKSPFDPAKVRELRFAVVMGGSVKASAISVTGKVLVKEDVQIPGTEPEPNPKLPPAIEFAIRELVAKAPEPSQEPLSAYASVLAEFARRLNADVVADAYDTYITLVPRAGRRYLPKRWEGNAMVVENGWLSSRSRRWATLRAQTVPRSVWRTLGGRSPLTVPLDEKAAFASRIDLEQSRSPLILNWEEFSYFFYRFWAATSPSMRARLLRGEKVPLRELPKELDEFLVTDPEGRGNVTGFYNASIFDEPEYSALDPDLVETEEDLDTDYAGLFPRRIHPDAYVKVIVADMPAVYFAEEQEVVGPSLLAQLLDLDAERDGLSRPTSVKLAQVRGMRFWFHLRPEINFDRAELNFTLGKSAPFALASWPEELRKRVAAARKRMMPDEDAPGKRIPPQSPNVSRR